MTDHIYHAVTIRRHDFHGTVFQAVCQCGYRSPNTSEVRAHELAENHLYDHTKKRKRR